MVEKGFHETQRPTWKTMMLIEGELYEAIEGIRKGKKADLKRFYKNTQNDPSDDNLFRIYFDACLKGTPEMEITDTYIRLLDYMGEVFTHDLWQKDSKFEKPVYENMFWTFYAEETKKNDENLFCLLRTDVTSYIRTVAKKYVPYGDVVHYETATGIAAVRAQLERLVEIMQFNLLEFITIKSRYNKLRPYKHGKQF